MSAFVFPSYINSAQCIKLALQKKTVIYHFCKPLNFEIQCHILQRQTNLEHQLLHEITLIMNLYIELILQKKIQYIIGEFYIIVYKKLNHLFFYGKFSLYLFLENFLVLIYGKFSLYFEIKYHFRSKKMFQELQNQFNENYVSRTTALKWDLNCLKVTETIEKYLKTENTTNYNRLIKNSSTLQKRTIEQNTLKNHQQMQNDYQSTAEIFSNEHFNQKQQSIQFVQKLPSKSLSVINCLSSSCSFSKINLQRYKSLTHILSQQIDDLIAFQKSQEQNERRMLSNQIQQYQQSIFSYFNKIVDLQFNKRNLNIIFGQNQFSYASNFEQKFLQRVFQQSRFLNNEQRKKMFQKLIQHKKMICFLKIILKNLPNEINLQILFITYLIINNVEQQQNEQKSEDCEYKNLFYNDKIKYLNFRFTKIDCLDVDIKEQFQKFINEFKSILSGLMRSQLNDNKMIFDFNSLIDRRDFFSSDDQQDQTQVMFIYGRKKIKY